MADVLVAHVCSQLSTCTGLTPDMTRPKYTTSIDDVPMYVSEQIDNKGCRASEPEFKAAKEKKLRGLLN